MQQSGVQMDILFLSYKNVAGSATILVENLCIIKSQ